MDMLASPRLAVSPATLARESSFGAVTYSDRFIPSRSSSNLSNFNLMPGPEGSNSAASADQREDGSQAYNAILRAELLGRPDTCPAELDYRGDAAARGTSLASPLGVSKNMFRFVNDGSVTSRPESPYATSPLGLNPGSLTPRATPRKISRSPFKVLDAPALQDDFYLNLVDWSSSNVLAVGLGTCVYLWSACTSKVVKLCDLAPTSDSVCSVAWTHRGTYLAVGTKLGLVQIWDAAKCRNVRTLPGHRMRVGALAWNGHTLSSGSRDRSVLERDVRAPGDAGRTLAGHRSEVCGLKWSFDNRELASGGNDNQLLVWNQHAPTPVHRFTQHTAAVKAIAWSPHQHGLLASGGGTVDRCIRFWNTVSGTPLHSIDTGSQVCNLVWSKNVNELVSTHGYSQNQIIVWRYPSMAKLATLTGHTQRALYLANSPDGKTIVTGAGDETLRFWSVFPGPKSEGSVNTSSVLSLGRTHIR